MYDYGLARAEHEFLTPPDNEATKYGVCQICGEPIFCGYRCFEADELLLCEDCVFDHIKEAG